MSDNELRCAFCGRACDVTVSIAGWRGSCDGKGGQRFVCSEACDRKWQLRHEEAAKRDTPICPECGHRPCSPRIASGYTCPEIHAAAEEAFQALGAWDRGRAAQATEVELYAFAKAHEALRRIGIGSWGSSTVSEAGVVGGVGRVGLGPVERALEQTLAHSPDAIVFRRSDGSQISAAGMVELLRAGDEAARAFADDVIGAAVRMVSVRARAPVPESAPAAAPVVHVLVGGRALCPLPGLPSSWPAGETWVHEQEAASEATCDGCLRAVSARAAR